MTPALSRIADAYASIQDALPEAMRAEFREHWLGAIREFGAACLEAVQSDCPSIEFAGFLVEWAEAIRSWD